MYTNLLLAAGMAATASAFDCTGAYFSMYNRGGSAMTYQRLDSALFPNEISGHLHSFDGGNGINADPTSDLEGLSTCSTARMKQDKSVYWRPTLFWNGNNTGYYKVPESYSKIYYKFGEASGWTNTTEFPQNFQMIVGNAMLRSEPNNTNAGVSWSCKGSNGNTDANGFPKGFTSCPGGFATQVTFPSCWNGNPIDPSNPSAHMEYPTLSGGGINSCPEGFRQARFPTIFIEFWWDVTSFDNTYSADSVPWVLAQGDPTGYGMHADFRMGWEKGVLGKAIAENGYLNCGCGCGEDSFKAYFGSDQVYNDDDTDFKSCSAVTDTYGVDVSKPLSTLPGCNPIQSGPADATVVTGAGCSATPTASSGSSSSAAGSASASATAASSSYAAGSASSKASAASSKASAASSKASSLASVQAQAATSLSVSLAGKQGSAYSTAPTSTASPIPTSEVSYSAPNKTAAAVSGGFSAPSGSAAASFVVAGSSAASAASSVSPAETSPAGDCQEPVYITVTPTVTVTAGAGAGNSTSCASTVYETVNLVQTVTVTSSGQAQATNKALGYKKRFMDAHKRGQHHHA